MPLPSFQNSCSSHKNQSSLRVLHLPHPINALLLHSNPKTPRKTTNVKTHRIRRSFEWARRGDRVVGWSRRKSVSKNIAHINTFKKDVPNHAKSAKRAKTFSKALVILCFQSPLVILDKYIHSLHSFPAHSFWRKTDFDYLWTFYPSSLEMATSSIKSLGSEFMYGYVSDS